ncbi:MAG TPA: cytochrome P450 [Terriglobia bacterium]|nr:cytochrome P450 [Terriglobia bacterium]
MQTSLVPPGPKGHFLLGALPDIRRDELDYLSRIVREYGDVVYVRVVNQPCYVLSHPRDIEYVLMGNYPNFKKSVFLRESRALFGEGLLTSDGGFWLRQRRMLQPAFHHDRIAEYSRVMVERTERMLATWGDGEVRDVHQDMSSLTLEIIAQVLFGSTIASQTEQIGEALRVFFEQFDERFGLYSIPEWVPTPGNLRYRMAIGRLNKILERVIQYRRLNGHDSKNVLSATLRTHDEDGSGMTERQLRDEMMTLFFTGHETTALALSWTWYLLGQHPEIADRVAEEVERVVGDRTPTFDDIPQMRLVDGVVKESLRLYPPAYGVVREALNDCEIGGYTIPAGATLAMFQWTVHRDARYFERPEDFVPERWTDDFSKSLPKCAYFPFGVGPRVCIGNTFALAELPLLVAMIARRYRFDLLPGHKVLLSPSLTLRPRKGIKVILKKRS